MTVRNAGLPPLFALLLIILASLTSPAQTKDYTKWVNPFIGTAGHGHTFPGATMPFGMVQLSPDTRTDSWDGSSGYHYSDDIIYGFSHTHLSGTGIPDYCDILFMPAIAEYKGPRPPNFEKFPGYASKFSHSDEVAAPGYYSVKLADRKVTVELTATQRVGFHRYTFPQSRKAGINLDLNWRDRLLDGDVKITGNKRLEGYRRSSSWAKNQTVYFVAEFSRKFDEVAVGSTGDKTHGAFFAFTPKAGDQILLKVAISSVSIEGARKNLETELPGWDFDKVRSEAKAAWNKELSKIEVSGGTDDQTTTFYTALYHTMIQPNIFQDVDGSYRGRDGKVHRVSSPHVSKGKGKPPATAGGSDPGDNYTVFSLWDTFRAAHPLYTIIDQKRTVDFINTFIRQYEQGGRLPVWDLWGEETDTMIGYHAVPVIADAMMKGIKGFDDEKAYQAAKHSAGLDHYGLAAYKKRGYISSEDEQESVSKTLEYAYDDWCIARMAMTLENMAMVQFNAAPPGEQDLYRGPMTLKENDRQEFSRRGQNFQNLFDRETGLMRPKQNGAFIQQFLPNEVTFSYTEANAWQYSFFVPQDIERLKSLMGGPRRFATKLDELFTTESKLIGRDQPDITGLIGQYAHGNEPSHHIAYLYNYANEPWKTQRYARKILDEFYRPTPDGLIGNEDCGQMSAWYVLSASGFYPVTPGFPTYDIGTPLFKEVRYHLENGKTFTIMAPDVSEKNIYVKSLRLNGELRQSPLILHADIMKGGVLEFEMSREPVETAFLGFSKGTTNHPFVPVPLIGNGRRTFHKLYEFPIKDDAPDTRIYYTLDGSEPNEKSVPYYGPITTTTDATIKAIAINGNGVKSMVAEARYHLIPNDWTVSIASKYNRQYTGGGDEGLTDGIRGTLNFSSGLWQGYQGQDFVATIDLQRETEIKKLGGGFLQNSRSWIWMPTNIEFEVSNDNANFTKVADVKTDIASDDMKEQIRDYVSSIAPVKARYVRVHAYNFGKIPAWHPGAGGDAFIFVDEIFID